MARSTARNHHGQNHNPQTNDRYNSAAQSANLNVDTDAPADLAAGASADLPTAPQVDLGGEQRQTGAPELRELGPDALIALLHLLGSPLPNQRADVEADLRQQLNGWRDLAAGWERYATSMELNVNELKAGVRDLYDEIDAREVRIVELTDLNNELCVFAAAVDMLDEKIAKIAFEFVDMFIAARGGDDGDDDTYDETDDGDTDGDTDDVGGHPSDGDADGDDQGGGGSRRDGGDGGHPAGPGSSAAGDTTSCGDEDEVIVLVTTGS